VSGPEGLVASALAFRWHAARRDWTNLSFRRHRHFDAYVVTMHQSGTHWLKYLLSLVLTREHGLPAPATIGDSIVIGGPRDRPRYAVSPRLGMSHTIPSPVLGPALAIPALGFPRYLVLIRDLRDALVAHYRKWDARYGCPFPEYLRGDVADRRFDKDLWWDLRFLNAWGRLARAHPARVQVLRYEDLRDDPAAILGRIVEFFAIPLREPAAAIAYAVGEATKDKMAHKETGELGLTIVRDEVRSWDEWYGPDDRRWLGAICRRFLEFDFGYGYADWR
jgi:hypothetical protein